jgi:3-isopropylmalate/(R)-2-methylmalate dehydratase large subunit
MGKTIIEKIIQAHSDEPVEAGKIVWMRLDARTARDFGGANVVKNYQKHYGASPVDDPNKTFFTFDLVTPANNIPYAVNQQICRDWAQVQGVRVFDVDMGIGSHVALERGLTWPGSTFVGTDSHLNILGAIGAFGQGMGDQDIAFTFKAGKTWFEVPATMKVTIKGTEAAVHGQRPDAGRAAACWAPAARWAWPSSSMGRPSMRSTFRGGSLWRA